MMSNQGAYYYVPTGTKQNSKGLKISSGFFGQYECSLYHNVNGKEYPFLKISYEATSLECVSMRDSIEHSCYGTTIFYYERDKEIGKKFEVTGIKIEDYIGKVVTNIKIVRKDEDSSAKVYIQIENHNDLILDLYSGHNDDYYHGKWYPINYIVDYNDEAFNVEADKNNINTDEMYSRMKQIIFKY